MNRPYENRYFGTALKKGERKVRPYKFGMAQGEHKVRPYIRFHRRIAKTS